MATKINDYSGFNTIFRDTAIGLVLSAGGISTLLPNMIEGYSETKNLGSYEALNSFSVVYFLVPILICTCYWMLRGHKLYIREKINEEERFDLDAPENLAKMTDTTLWIYVVTILKVFPIFIFLFNASYLNFEFSWLALGLWYIGISFFEMLLAGRSNEKYLESKLNGKNQDSRYRDMLNNGFTMHALIFSLDLFLGLALIIFIGPWVLYSESFYWAFAVTVCIYSIAFLILIYGRSKLKFSESRWRVAPVIFCFIFIGTTVPSVNLKNFSPVTILCFTGFALFLIGSYILEDLKEKAKRNEAKSNTSEEDGQLKEKEKAKANKVFAGYTILVMGLGASIVCLIIQPMYNKLNAEYFYSRLEASKSFSDYEKFPLSLVAKKSNRDNPWKSSLTNAIDTLHNMNMNMAFEVKQDTSSFIRILQTLRMDPDSVTGISELYYKRYHELLQKVNVKSKRDTDRKLKSYSLNPDSLNRFYERINKYVDDEVFPTYIIRSRELKLNSELDYLRHYEHPLDYYSFVFDEYVKQKDSARLMLDLIVKIHDNQKFLDSSRPKPSETEKTALSSEIVPSIPLHQNQLVSELKKMYEKHWELTPVAVRIDSLVKHNATAWLVNFHSKYLEYKEHMYANRYKKARIIYRSYLLDSQRIGVYFFLASLGVISLALAFNYRDERKFFQPVKIDEEKALYPLPPDMPSKSLFIQALALVVLLIPLLKPIKPSNINPEKPYWMLSIQNWNAPVFAAKLSKPESEPKPSTPSLEPTDVTPIVKQLTTMETNLKQVLDSINSATRDQSTYPKPEKQ